MKITIRCFVHHRTDLWATEEFEANAHVMSKYEGYVLIGPAEFEFDVPDTFNPTQAQVANLEQQLGNLADDYHRAAAMIRDKISKLQCIENSPVGGA